MKSTIFLDMDGVLVDFAGGALQAHNKELDYENISWGFYEQVGLTEAEFWKPLGYDFWRTLSWTMEGKLLLTALEQLVGEENVILLTSPCETPGCIDGKMAWIKREMPSYTRRFLIGPPKYALAAPGKVLVDDYPGNINKYVKAGGHGVLVPRPWNDLNNLAHKTGFDVTDVLERVQVGLCS